MNRPLALTATVVLLLLITLAVFTHKQDEKNNQVTITKKAEKVEENARPLEAKTVVRENSLIEERLGSQLTPRRKRRVIPIPGVAIENRITAKGAIPEDKKLTL